MKDHDRGRAANRRFPKHVTRLHDRAVQRPDRQHRRPHDPVLGVEQDDPELLHSARPEPGHQVRRRIFRPANLQPRARRERQRAPAQLERRHNLRGPGAADSGNPDEVVGRAPRQPVQPAVRGQQGVRDAQRIAATGSVAEDQRDQLVVAERRRPMVLELLARPIVGQQVFHRTTAERILERMSSLRRLLLSLAVLAAVAGAACGDPPDKEMQQAQGAIDAARAAGADQYAREEFTAAEDALKRSHEAVAQRDYRQALNTALDARERARAAAKESVNSKATARADATKALADAEAALHESRAKLKAAEAARAPARALSNGRRAIDNGESAVQEARTAFEKGDYLGAIDTVRSVSAHLGTATHDLDVAAAAGGRRRH